MTHIILASKSQIRADILHNAGIDFTQIGSDVDEDVIKQKYHDKDISETVIALAFAKALAVNHHYHDHYVIGCDQMLECQGKRYDKAQNTDELRQDLKELRGKTQYLHNGICIYHQQQILWQYHDMVAITLRDFSDEFLENYITHHACDVLSSVGGCQIEKNGTQLVESIKGDYFSILGLPILVLLPILRQYGLLTS